MTERTRVEMRLPTPLVEAVDGLLDAVPRTTLVERLLARWVAEERTLPAKLGVAGSAAPEGQVPAAEPRPDPKPRIPPKGPKPPQQARPVAMAEGAHEHKWRKVASSSGVKIEACECGARR